MNTIKKEITELLTTLSDDSTIEDIQYHLYVLQKIKRGYQNIEENKLYSSEQVKDKLGKWLEK